MKKTITRLTDDIDGSEAAETIRFAVRGVDYEIDVSAQNADHFWQVLRPYLDHARRNGKASSGPKQSVVREWALANGIEVSNRGRVAREIVDHYLAAQ